MISVSAIFGRSFTTSSTQLLAYMKDDGLRGEQLVSAIGGTTVVINDPENPTHDPSLLAQAQEAMTTEQLAFFNEIPVQAQRAFLAYYRGGEFYGVGPKLENEVVVGKVLYENAGSAIASSIAHAYGINTQGIGAFSKIATETYALAPVQVASSDPNFNPDNFGRGQLNISDFFGWISSQSFEMNQSANLISGTQSVLEEYAGGNTLFENFAERNIPNDAEVQLLTKGGEWLTIQGNPQNVAERTIGNGPGNTLVSGTPLVTLEEGEGITLDDIQDYAAKSLKQIVYGNFSDDVTLGGTLGQVALGFTGLDAPADIRDVIHDFQHWEWSWGHAGQTALDGIGFFPVIGAIKFGDETALLLKKARKAEKAESMLEIRPLTFTRFVESGNFNGKALFGTDPTLVVKDIAKERIKYPHLSREELYKPRYNAFDTVAMIEEGLIPPKGFYSINELGDAKATKEFFESQGVKTELMYIMKEDGTMKFAVRRKDDVLPHSYLADGEEVLAAGKLDFDEEGVYDFVMSPSTGHYKVMEKQVENVTLPHIINQSDYTFDFDPNHTSL